MYTLAQDEHRESRRNVITIFRCDNCEKNLGDQDRKPRVERLSPGLVRTLIKFKEAVERYNKNDIHLQREADLTKNEYNNFQKLRYHGLVHKVRNGEKGYHSGRWLITRLGGQFLRCEVGVCRDVYVLDNQVV